MSASFQLGLDFFAGQYTGHSVIDSALQMHGFLIFVKKESRIFENGAIVEHIVF